MIIYIWKDLDKITSNYHDGGGCVIIANGVPESMQLARQTQEIPKDSDIFTTPPDLSYVLDGEAAPEVILYPNAGCC